MVRWTEKSIPSLLKIPIIGQLTNAMFEQKFATIWYQYSLPKNHPDRTGYQHLAQTSLSHGGCFCLSSLVQGLKNDENTPLYVSEVPLTLVWGAKDFTHRNTDKESIKSHVRDCEIIEFRECGHFPELENTPEYVRLIKERLNQ
jgi:pimeloyl-ACP methyl ester carboxylesterase